MNSIVAAVLALGIISIVSSYVRHARQNKFSAANPEKMIAVVRCQGTCNKRTQTINNSESETCSVPNETACNYGCIGCGNCAHACPNGAITINPETKIAEVNPEKCTACGACVKACPRGIIELRKKGYHNGLVYVGCMNRDKGAAALKVCNTACIGCGKCLKRCRYGAITINNNLSYIDSNLCRQCHHCVHVCPTHAIVSTNLRVRKAN